MNELPQNQQVDEKGGEIAQASPAADDPSETSIYPHPNKRIKEYLLEHVSDYRRLDKLRRQVSHVPHTRPQNENLAHTYTRIH